MEPLYKKNSGVINLTLFDFKGKKVNFHGKEGLINFYAPWCVHCRKMQDMWSELAIHFKDRFVISAVNCEDPFNYNLRWIFDIVYYPTLKFVDKKGNITDYEGDIEKDNLLEFISSRLGPS